MTTTAQTTQVYSVFLRATPQAVWDAITKPEFTSRYFFGSHVESTLKNGAPIVHYSPDHSSVWAEGEVVEADPPRRLVHTWRALWDADTAADAPSRVTWEIEPQDGGICKLTVVHDEFDGETATYRTVATGWNLVLSGLKTLVETGEPLTAA